MNYHHIKEKCRLHATEGKNRKDSQTRPKRKKKGGKKQ